MVVLATFCDVWARIILHASETYIWIMLCHRITILPFNAQLPVANETKRSLWA